MRLGWLVVPYVNSFVPLSFFVVPTLVKFVKCVLHDGHAAVNEMRCRRHAGGSASGGRRGPTSFKYIDCKFADLVKVPKSDGRYET